MTRRRSAAVALLLVLTLASCRSRSQQDTGSRAELADCEKLPVVVHLVGEHHELVMYEGAHEPMYTVRDKAGGIVEACIGEDSLFLAHPELESPTLGVIHTLHSSQMGYLH